MKSRLAGLSVAIEPPDFETRAAIVLAKAQAKGVDLPEESRADGQTHAFELRISRRAQHAGRAR